jgi:hypothetical protein
LGGVLVHAGAYLGDEGPRIGQDADDGQLGSCLSQVVDRGVGLSAGGHGRADAEHVDGLIDTGGG